MLVITDSSTNGRGELVNVPTTGLVAIQHSRAFADRAVRVFSFHRSGVLQAKELA